jgi:hypothetical protein
MKKFGLEIPIVTKNTEELLQMHIKDISPMIPKETLHVIDILSFICALIFVIPIAGFVVRIKIRRVL